MWLALVIFLDFLRYSTPDDPKYPWYEQISRQEQLTEGCEKLGLGRRRGAVGFSQLDHLLVDPNHKLLYCYVPKIACTNWKRVMMVLTGRSNVSNLVDIPASVAHANYSTVRLSQLPPSEIRTVLREYTLFLIVRHPFERLLSAYRNKFTETLPSSKYFQARYGKEIIKKYRRGAVSSDANVTFSEFVAYLLDEGAETNEHWRPVYDMCLPCTLNYTFVGRYETLVEDARTVLNMVGAPPLAFPVTRPARTRDNLKRYYQELSVYTIGRLYRRYLADFKLFGYGLEDLLGYDLA